MNFLKLLFLLFISGALFAQDIDELDLLDSNDIDILSIEGIENATSGEKQQVIKTNNKLNLSEIEEVDDLDSLKNDLGEAFTDAEEKQNVIDGDRERENEPEIVIKKNKKDVIVNTKEFVKKKEEERVIKDKTVIFDVGDEEKKLLELSRYVEGKIPQREWQEISSGTKLEKYVVQEGDWLWKISKKLFGSGFYYSKIWALNPQITNPHEIEPGMVLVFDMGDFDSLPQVRVGRFKDEEVKAGDFFDYSRFGEDIKPKWIDERKDLMRQGLFFQYASEETYEDLVGLSQRSLIEEYKKYVPPATEIVIEEPSEEYDNVGFDKDSKISFDVKEGFFLNTFVSTNIIQDLGEIVAFPKESVLIRKFDTVYVKFDRGIKLKPGDVFSAYSAEGEVSHPVSDRSGYRYTISGELRAIRKINDVWECQVTDISGLLQRRDRITVYVPKINKVKKTFNVRNIEAAVIGSYDDKAAFSLGDVVYLDRGRADGVEMGNIFQLYSFLDRGTGKRITADPTYKVGEITIISITDNFATGLLSQSSNEINLGSIAITKTQEQAAREARVKREGLLLGLRKEEQEALDELDIELNLDEASADLLEKADKIKITEDELEELERLEREKSVIRDTERDLRELDRLEKEVIEAEVKLGESRLDEDKYLEQQDLERLEKQGKDIDPNAFESLDEIEQDIGRKYLDEDINAKENPYGLTEFDLEEIDELLNTDSQE